MKSRVIMYERILLKTFGFIIHIAHPHKFVISYTHLLEGGEQMQQLAWNILNDRWVALLGTCVAFGSALHAVCVLSHALVLLHHIGPVLQGMLPNPRERMHVTRMCMQLHLRQPLDPHGASRAFWMIKQHGTHTLRVSASLFVAWRPWLYVSGLRAFALAAPPPRRPPLPARSLRTNLCVRFKGEVVACGAIFLAARRLKVRLWWAWDGR